MLAKEPAPLPIFPPYFRGSTNSEQIFNIRIRIDLPLLVKLAQYFLGLSVERQGINQDYLSGYLEGLDFGYDHG